MPLTAANQGGLDPPVMANSPANSAILRFALALAILAVGAAGCTRGRYYTQADRYRFPGSIVPPWPDIVTSSHDQPGGSWVESEAV